MVNSHTFVLTKKQTDKLTDVVDKFYNRAAQSPAVSPAFLLLLGGIRRAILDGDSLEQYQNDAILWMLDSIFTQMEEHDIDPLLEQVYQKLAGWWPVSPPWYERIKDL